MDVATIKTTREKIKDLLGWRRRNEIKALQDAYGLLKRLKKDAVQYQRELRRERK